MLPLAAALLPGLVIGALAAAGAPTGRRLRTLGLVVLGGLAGFVVGAVAGAAVDVALGDGRWLLAFGAVGAGVVALALAAGLRRLDQRPRG